MCDPISFFVCPLMYIECVGVIKCVRKPFDIRQLSQKSPIPRTKVFSRAKKNEKWLSTKAGKGQEKQTCIRFWWPMCSSVRLNPCYLHAQRSQDTSNTVLHNCQLAKILDPPSRQRKTSSPSVWSVYIIFMLNTHRTRRTQCYMTVN